MITLQKGAVYQSRSNGMVEYIGLDRFWGETTHKFRRLAVGDMTYIQPEQLDEFLAPQETLETIKQQLDDLLAAQQDHQRLVRQLDVLLNGEEGAAQQASLCDLVSQVAKSGVVARSDALLSALHGVADILDELSQEQSVSSLQGGAAGAASGIRLSIIKILGGAS